MAINRMEEARRAAAVSAARGREILQSLVSIASSTANSQLDGFSLRLSNALMAYSETAIDSKQANLGFVGASLLKKNGYAFYYLASVRLEEALRQELQAIERRDQPAKAAAEDALALVSYDEMDNKVLLANLARPLELQYGEQLKALSIRLAYLLDRDDLPLSQNPFRPEVFLSAMNAAWAEFDPEEASHPLVLPLMQPDVFIDLAPIYQAVNDALISYGILPSLTDSYRVKKSSEPAASAKKADDRVTEELRRMLGGSGGFGEGNGSGMSGGVAGSVADVGGPGAALPGGLQDHVLHMTAVSNQLLGFLAGMQKTVFDQQLAGLSAANTHTTEVLANIKRQAPSGALTQVHEHTIDLLMRIFEMVFRDQHIAAEMKALIGFLQVPILKAALIDKEFFFKQEHPARRLVESLAQSSLAWDQQKGQDDPLYQTMKQVVDRIQKDFDQQISVFDDGVNDLERFKKQEEAASAQTLAAPITNAMKEEKLVLAKRVAKNDVAMRIGTGEVVAFVETFLENKWVSVLTLAYSLQDEKPQAVASAVSTMDDLIWSVKPKITPQQRKELIAKLPSILSRLNKWFNIVKWEEADRLQFFAELAETHASIVRAPLPMTPERQVELAIEVAKKAAERRLEKLAQAQADPGPDEHDERVKQIERGVWLNFTPKNGEARRAKLSWVSPMHSLFIFTTKKKEETFQLTDEQFAQMFRAGEVQPVLIEGLVDRALTEAFAPVANDPKIAERNAA